MDHNEAKTTKATERYLLDEMQPGERDAFEDHYFDCSECAEDVRDGAKMIAAGRQVAREPEPVREPGTVHPMPRRGWTGWVPQAAAAAVVAGFGGWYGALQTVAPRAAAVALITRPAQVELDLGENRGPGAAQTRVAAGKPASLNFFIPVHPEAASYRAIVRDATGGVRFEDSISAEETEKVVSLVLPAELPRGGYEVVIEGVRKDGNRFSITRVPFEVVGESEGS